MSALPHFKHPPVIEVAMSVQFERIEGLTTGHLGLLWDRYRERFPHCEEQPGLETTLERFGEQRRGGPSVRIVTNPAADVRLWFLDDRKAELLQVQHDRFIRNWRKSEQEDDYPKYEEIKRRFQNDLTIFDQFLRSEQLPPIAPNQCELTYVNHITGSGIWEKHGEAARVFRFLRDQELERELEIDDVRFNIRRRLLDDHGTPLGRLHLTVDAAFHAKSKEPIFVFKIVARGEPDSGDASGSGAIAFLDRAHEHIVRAFAAATTDQMHQQWGLEQ